jgi:hypothetical protein
MPVSVRAIPRWNTCLRARIGPHARLEGEGSSQTCS